MKCSIIIPMLLCAAMAAAQVPKDALAHYPMNGEASDATANHNMGSIVGNVTPTADRFGNPCGALLFDGSTGYITVPNSPSLQRPIDAFSVAVWVKLQQYPSNPQRKWLTVCCKSDQPQETLDSPQFRVQSMQDDAKGYNTVSISTDFTEPAQENLILNQWFFYVVRYDGANVTAYIDGKSAFTFAYTKSFTANSMPLEIGRDVPGGMEFFAGSMDDLRIFDRALSTAEISALYKDQSGKAAPADVVIQCPADITKTALPGKCGFPVNYPEATANVNCGTAKVRLLSGPVTESMFPVGATTVTFEASSQAGKTATCSFQVRVVDNTPLTLQCPKPIKVNADPGMCSAVVTYAEATAGSACTPPQLERTLGRASGDDFPLGDTKVVYQATDAAGATATCTFTVTVKDAEAPTIQCPQDLRVQADAGSRTAPVTYTLPTYADNCPGTKLVRTAGLAPGADFPLGKTSLTYQARDAAGLSATCSFAVTVEATQTDLGLRCPENLVLPADKGDCAATANWKMPTLTGNLPDATVSQSAGLANGDRFSIGTQTISYKATHPGGKQANCSFTVTVTDQEKPRIDCPSDLKVTAENASGAVVRYVDALALDNCEGVTSKRIAGRASGETFPLGTTTLSYEARDAAGNTATCSFKVTVQPRQSELAIRCPKDMIVNAAQGQCTAAPLFADATVTTEIHYDANGLPDVNVRQVGGEPSGSDLAIGTHTVTYAAEHTDGKQAQCSFRITVKDAETPVIACPNDVSVAAPYGTPGAPYKYELPAIDDNCPGATLKRLEGLESGAQFPLGENKVVYQVQDAAGNTSSCDFIVKVTSEQPALPRKIEGDTVVYHKEIVQVRSNQVRIYFYDNQDQDGDTVSLMYDGHWVVDHEKILGKKRAMNNNAYLDLVITPNKIHYLVSKAWNEGKKPTNTLTIEIHDGVSPPRILDLTSTIGKSSAIQLYYKN